MTESPKTKNAFRRWSTAAIGAATLVGGLAVTSSVAGAVEGAGATRSGVVAEALGLETADVKDALRDGQTLADIAGEQGVAVDDLIDAITEAAHARLDAAVESGRIDAEDAEARAETLEERVTARVNGEFTAEHRRARRGLKTGVIADALGLEVEDVRDLSLIHI